MPLSDLRRSRKLPLKCHCPFAIFFRYRCISSASNRCRSLILRRRRVYFFREPGQVFIGIECIAVLVGPVQRTLPERIQQAKTFPSRKAPCAQGRHLSFEHFFEVRNMQFISVEANQVVGMKQPVVPFTGTDALRCQLQGMIDKLQQFTDRITAFVPVNVRA